jgi:hypothetical protein
MDKLLLNSSDLEFLNKLIKGEEFKEVVFGSSDDDYISKRIDEVNLESKLSYLRIQEISEILVCNMNIVGNPSKYYYEKLFKIDDEKIIYNPSIINLFINNINE